MVSSHTGYEEIVFWGKITGTIRDYYIIMGINFVDKYEFPEKGFFWATS
jgi:radial spoke head protein 9